MENKFLDLIGKCDLKVFYAFVFVWALVPMSAIAGTIYTCQTADGRLHKLEQPCGKYKEISRQEPKVVSVTWVTHAARSTPIAKSPKVMEMIFALAHSDQSKTYRVRGKIENLPVDFMVDTGASYVAIPEKMAGWAGLGCMKRVYMSTANGIATACTSMIKNLRIGDIVLHDVEVVIQKNLPEVLLGQSALRSLKVEQYEGVLKLSASKNQTFAAATME